MFQVSVEETFSAGHALRGYKGKCENPHGHNYRVRVEVEGKQLDSIGLLFDFGDLKRILRELIGDDSRTAVGAWQERRVPVPVRRAASGDKDNCRKRPRA